MMAYSSFLSLQRQELIVCPSWKNKPFFFLNQVLQKAHPFQYTTFDNRKVYK